MDKEIETEEQLPEPRSRFTCIAPTPQPNEIRCFTCGAYIAHDAELVSAAISMQKLENAKEGNYLPEFSSMMPNKGAQVDDLLSALGYESLCCRSKLLSMLPHKGQRT